MNTDTETAEAVTEQTTEAPTSDIISGWAYAQADSMIRAREAGQ